MPHDIPAPWDAFLLDLDQLLDESVEFHCLGGFVMAMLYGLKRPTADVDVLAIKPRVDLTPRAGKGSALHKKHGVYLDVVTVLEAYPEDYEQRLTELFPGAFGRLRLRALDPYGLVLTKLGNSPKDREDVYHLADAVPLEIDILRSRYDEMRPYLGNPTREDLTLKLWTEAIEERRRAKRRP